MHDMDLFQLITITDNKLLLMVHAHKITDNFTLLYFNEQFITCSSCTPEKGYESQ